MNDLGGGSRMTPKSTLNPLSAPQLPRGRGGYLSVGRLQKVLVLSSYNWASPSDEPPLSVTEISTSALESLVLSSETKSVRGGLSGGGYGGFFDLKYKSAQTHRLKSADPDFHCAKHSPQGPGGAPEWPRGVVRSTLLPVTGDRQTA